jgi:hypothetical protein
VEIAFHAGSGSSLILLCLCPPPNAANPFVFRFLGKKLDIQ